MRCRKAVTKKKLEANRNNSKRSTGPRTEQGKSTARFNALTFGLFAKHVVIPECDDDGNCGGQVKFKALVDSLHQEFQPVGIFEEWLVVRVAEGMWKLRRATRCENGAVRNSALWAELNTNDPPYDPYRPQNGRLPLEFDMMRSSGGIFELKFVLTDAEKQIRETGTLSPETSGLLVRCFGKQEAFQPTEGDQLSRVITDQDMLLGWIADRKARLEGRLEIRLRVEARQCADDLAYHSLPPADDLDKILRYEKRIHKQLDWALRRLLASQEARKARLPSPALSGNVRARPFT